MEKSLYFQLVNKYFPQLVASVVEKLNGKNQTALTYMYRDHLTNTYSQDGRWASITAEYTRVAADVVSMDAELPLKSRDKVSTAEGQIPKVGMKLYMSEKQLKDLDNMIAQRLPQPQILRNLFADLPRCIQAVYERIEDMFLSELSTGVALATRSVVQKLRYSFIILSRNFTAVVFQYTSYVLGINIAKTFSSLNPFSFKKIESLKAVNKDRLSASI